MALYPTGKRTAPRSGIVETYNKPKATTTMGAIDRTLATEGVNTPRATNPPNKEGINQPQATTTMGAINKAIATEGVNTPTATNLPKPNIEAANRPQATTSGYIKTAAELQRDQVRASQQKEEQARMEAIKRQASASGIDDSGIVAARERGAIQDVRQGAGEQLTDINIAEQQGKAQELENEKTRQAVAENLASQLGVQQLLGEMGFDVTERGQDIQKELGQEGFDVTKRGQDVQSEISIRDAATRLQLADKEMDALTSAKLSDFQKAVTVAAMENIQINNPNNRQMLNDLFDSMGIDIKLPIDTQNYVNPTDGNNIWNPTTRQWESTPTEGVNTPTANTSFSGTLTLTNGFHVPAAGLASGEYYKQGDTVFHNTKNGPIPIGKTK